jgi:hypothetical protein
MLAAALFAVTDLSQQGTLPIGVTELNEAIIAAAASYAAPATSVYLKSFAKSIAEMLGRCAQSVRDSLTGPLWVGPVRYVELDHDTISEIKEPPVKVLQDGTLVARL